MNPTDVVSIIVAVVVVGAALLWWLLAPKDLDSRLRKQRADVAACFGFAAAVFLLLALLNVFNAEFGRKAAIGFLAGIALLVIGVVQFVRYFLMARNLRREATLQTEGRTGDPA